jgi:hypothetical protein
MRLPLVLSLVLLLLAVSSAAAERPFRIHSEDAFATQCKMVSVPSEPGVPNDPSVPGVPSDPTVPSQASVPSVQEQKQLCATVQVSRTRYSDDIEETILFFSAYYVGPDNERSEIPVFSNPFFQIEREHFVVDRFGTRAILNFPAGVDHPGALVTWGATDDFSSASFSTNITKEKTAEGFIKSRVTEREREFSADAEGVVWPVIFATGNTEAAGNGDSGSAFLTIRTTVSRTRLLEEGRDFFDFTE